MVREKTGTHLYEVCYRELVALVLGGFEERKEDNLLRKFPERAGTRG